MQTKDPLSTADFFARVMGCVFAGLFAGVAMVAFIAGNEWAGASNTLLAVLWLAVGLFLPRFRRWRKARREQPDRVEG